VPVHDDKQNSLSIHHRDGKWLLKCHAGCEVEIITAALDLTLADLFDDKPIRGRRAFNPPTNRATVQPGLTLEQYSAAKRLPVEFLRRCGLTDVSYDGAPAVRIPYLGPGGELLAVRFRIAVGGDRFRWTVGSKPQL
jgi:hypothetical protein